MPDGVFEPPSLGLFLSEPARAAHDYALSLATSAWLRRLPRGDGHPVLVLPGLLADDLSTLRMRNVLRRLGYRAHGWGLGRNVGPTHAVVSGLGPALTDLADSTGRPVSIVGWSLGGIFARDLARQHPHSVRQVITLVSPFRMEHSSQSRAHPTYEGFADRHVRRRELPLDSEATPLPVPATSIYSRWDGITHWRACRDDPGERRESVGVAASHLGIGNHPAALYVIADRLAQPEGSWRPFRPPGALRHGFELDPLGETTSPPAARAEGVG